MQLTSKVSSVTAVIAIAALVSACASVRVFSPDPTSEEMVPGQVDGLATMVKDDVQPLTLVFVHGVGDHCRGYAIGDAESQTVTNAAWLNDAVAKQLGLTYELHTQNDSVVTSKEIQVGAKGSDSINVTLVRQRNYIWTIPDRSTPLEVRAFEVTWSPLTRWIKNFLVGYDASSIAPFPFINGGPGIDLCNGDIADTLGRQAPPEQSFSPPSRLPANGYLKWTLMDRSLTDPLIYAGTYGEAMQRGLGAALCRIAGGKETNDEPCVWPRKEDFTKGHFVFVTHSLGSRLLYDTLLNLSATDGKPYKYPDVFSANYIAQASQVIRPMIAQTAGFYMMANQLTMLGTGNVPINAPFNQQQPYIAHLGAPAPEDAHDITNLTQADSFVQLLDIRGQSPQIRSTSPALAVVSFNDTNDLLTWHLPAWYASALGAHPYGIKVADVFVKNAAYILYLLEWPTSAHGDYFTNRDVWQIMFCGANHGAPTQCLQ